MPKSVEETKPRQGERSIGGVGSRTFKVDSTRSINQEERTVELAFSSDAPVMVWGDYEILDHNPRSVRMGRLNNAGALLLEHVRKDQIGVIVRAWIDGDGKGRAVVKFSRSQFAEDIFQDVIDGIRQLTSVGFTYYAYELEGEENGVRTYRVTDWEPYEISIVSVPADVNAGVDRSHQNQVQPTNQRKTTTTGEGATMPDENVVLENEETTTRQRSAVPVPAAPAVIITPEEQARERKLAREGEIERMNEIRALATQHNLGELADEAIEKGDSVESFRSAALAKLSERNNGRKEGDAVPAIGMSGEDVEQFSFARTMAAVLAPNNSSVRKLAAYELEVCKETQARAGFGSDGLMVPADVIRHRSMPTGQRDLNVTTPTAGGNLVSEDLLTYSFIDLLRNQLIVSQLGATRLGDLQGNVSIPKQTAAGQAYWIDAEGNAPTESQQTVGQVPMTPKTLGAFTDFTRQLLLQSSMDVESFVRMDLARVMALAIDLAAIYGTGLAGQPTGLVNQAGIGSVTFAAANPTFPEVVDLESEVAVANADLGSMGYAVNAAMRGHFKQTPKFSGADSITIWEPGNLLNGHNTAVSNQVVDGDLIFGHWAALIIGMWGGLDFMVDPFALSTSGGTRIVTLQSIDTAVRHAQSFALGNDGV